MDNDTLFKTLSTIQDELESERRIVEPTWQEVMDLVLPRKSDTGRGSPGFYRERKRYDATAMNGNERLAAAIVGAMTPQTLEWFELALGLTLTAKSVYEVDDWTQTVARIMHRYLQQSNFAVELEEMLLDMGSVGTGALFEDQSPRKKGRFTGLAFQAWAVGEYWISEGPDGRVNRIHRKASFTADQMIRKFGQDNVHQKVRDAVEKNDRLQKFDVIQAIWETLEGERVSPKADRFPVANVFMDLTNKHVIDTGGFYEFPAPVGRWKKASGMVYGYGPGVTSLPDNQILNEADKLGLTAWSNNIAPPLTMLHEGVIGRPDLRSRRINTITEPNALQFLVVPSDVNADLVRRQEKQSAIREIFFMDQVNFLPDRGKTPPTAAEVQARLNIMLQILGPTLHGFEFAVLQPVINRTFQILNREGEIPPPPQEVIEQSGGRLTIQFIGPIARARKQADAAAIDNFLNRVLMLAQARPDALRTLDIDEIVRQISRVEGVSQSVFKSAAQLKKEMEAQQQQAAQEQALVHAKVAGEAATAIGQAQRVQQGAA